MTEVTYELIVIRHLNENEDKHYNLTGSQHVTLKRISWFV